MPTIKQHFVTFYSPGTLFAETDTKPIKAWNVATAKRMARRVIARYGATPYAFRFTTRGRGKNDLDSTVIKTSPIYYLGGTVETLAQVKARATAADSILISNMECNGYERVITNCNSFKATLPLHPGDVVLEWTT